MRRIGIVAIPDFQIVDLAAVAVFELANASVDKPAYEITLLSESGTSVATSAGIRIETRPFGVVSADISTPDASNDGAGVFDTLLVTGDLAVSPPSPGLLQFVATAAVTARRVASICTGAFVLAEAGLLDGRRATTHWAKARELQRRFPAIKVEEDRIFIADGSVWTSAGMSACIDLALALVEADLGAEVSRAIARKMVVYHRRSGGQSQFSALLELDPKSDRIQHALAYARRNLGKSLSVGSLAEVANLSARQFSRAFRAETGQSPAKAIESLRVEAARALVEESRHAIDVVARQTGFADPERMRRAFIRKFGHPPQTFRRVANRANGSGNR